MALAYLWSSIVKPGSRESRSPRFQTFIVDHKAREGSTEEAIEVSNRIETLLGESSIAWSLVRSVLNGKCRSEAEHTYPRMASRHGA